MSRVKTSDDFAQGLLEQEQTVVTDGAGFGAEGYLRISYATSMEQLQEGIKQNRTFRDRPAAGLKQAAAVTQHNNEKAASASR